MESIGTGNGNGIKLEEYQGNFSLTSQREKDGNFYGQWATYQIGKDKHAEKDWPVKVALGDRETAIGVLQMLLAELQNQDVPF